MSEHVERGAQEEQSGAPLTETEVAASKRAPSQADRDKDPGSGRSKVEEGAPDIRGASSADRQPEDPA